MFINSPVRTVRNYRLRCYTRELQHLLTLYRDAQHCSHHVPALHVLVSYRRQSVRTLVALTREAKRKAA